MQKTYKELKELAVIAPTTLGHPRAAESRLNSGTWLGNISAKAAQLGPLPDIGDPPPTLLRDKPASLTEPFLSSGLPRRRP
jgi:hypothetical protein